MDLLKSMVPEDDLDDVGIQICKSEMIDALANVRLSHPTEV